MRLGNTLFTSLSSANRDEGPHSPQHSACDPAPSHSQEEPESSTDTGSSYLGLDADLVEAETSAQTEGSPSSERSQTGHEPDTAHTSTPHLHQADALDGIGYWQVTWLYLTSLLKLGEVYDMAGSHEDALHAFKEGQELVCMSLAPWDV